MSPAIPTAVTLIGRHVAGAFRLRRGGLSLAKPAVHVFPAALRPKRSEDARSPSASPARSAGYDGASVGPGHIRDYCELDETSKALMRSAMNQLGLSARAFHRVLKLARTIADLAGVEQIQAAHLGCRKQNARLWKGSGVALKEWRFL